MADSFILNLIANRLDGNQFGQSTEIYKFEKIKRAKKEFLKNNPTRVLLDFGVGEPDKKPNQGIIDELNLWSNKLEKHGYMDSGTMEFRQASIDFMHNFFGVNNLDASTNIVPTIGSKEALANFTKCLINPGDIILQTTPGYPIMATNTKYLGGEVYNLPLLAKNNFLPLLEDIPLHILTRAKILYLNYPNNPTGAIATPEFLSTAVNFAKKNNIVIAYDTAYGTLTFTGKPLSILSIPGAIDVCVEFHSFSKSFSMTGWRLGFCVGNPTLISALNTIKDNCDSGSFEAIQKAGIFALNNQTELIKEINELYLRRLNLMVETLNKHGFKSQIPGGTFYLFVKSPQRINDINFLTAEAVAKFLIEQVGIVCVPWDENGYSFLRFSATFVAQNANDEKIALNELDMRLSNLKIEF